MKVLVTAALLLISVAAVFCAPPKCRVCDQPITGESYPAKDKAHGGKFEVCASCMNLPGRCFSCSLPVKAGFTTLADGRTLCAPCSKEAITDDEEARKICLEARDALDRLFARFFSFPQTNLSVTLVDSFTLDSLFKSPGYARQCTSVSGATRTMIVGGKRYIHAISVLNGMSQPQLEAVAAHDFAHAWLNENLSQARWATLSGEAVEGFCELIAYDLMQDRNYQAQKNNIKERSYTAGQLEAFVATESIHGFNAVLDWIKAGETPALDPNDLDGIRVVRAGAPAASKTALPGVLYVNAKAAPPPEKLMLKSISGSGNRRLAIINDRTLAINEQARMKLATTNVLIRCLEIGSNSVRIKLEETGKVQELFLPEN